VLVPERLEKEAEKIREDDKRNRAEFDKAHKARSKAVDEIFERLDQNRESMKSSLAHSIALLEAMEFDEGPETETRASETFCLGAGTLVKTKDNEVKIEDLVKGDCVLADDPINEICALLEVEEVYERGL
jgi:hypothetical protein